MKKQYITYTLLSIAGMLVAPGCSESDVRDLFPDDYSKILYIKDGGEKNVTLYVTGQDTRYSFKVCKGGSDPAMSAAASLEIMSQQDVDQAYSIPYGESYKVLASDAYALSTDNIEFGTADMAQTIDVTLRVDRIRQIVEADPASIYMLPVRLVSATDSVNINHNNYVIIIDDVSEPRLGFKKTGLEAITCDISKPFSMSLPLGMVGGVENKWNVTAGIAIDSDFLDSYNKSNGTSYALPDIDYEVTHNVELRSDRQEALVNISIPDFGNRTSGYMMIPVKISDVSMFAISEPDAHYAALLHLTGHKFDRSAWLAKACSEQHYEVFDWGSESDCSAGKVLDGDNSTFWHYKYGSKGEGSCSGHASGKHCIMLDTRDKRTFTQIGLVQRDGGVWNILKSVRFWVSDDDSVWNRNASDHTGWTPIDGVYVMTEDTDQREHIFDIQASTGRYLKVEVVESARGNDVGALAEIYCYGK